MPLKSLLQADSILFLDAFDLIEDSLNSLQPGTGWIKECSCVGERQTLHEVKWKWCGRAGEISKSAGDRSLSSTFIALAKKMCGVWNLFWRQQYDLKHLCLGRITLDYGESPGWSLEEKVVKCISYRFAWRLLPPVWLRTYAVSKTFLVVSLLNFPSIGDTVRNGKWRDLSDFCFVLFWVGG